MEYKSGFIAIVGRPNAGKSTFLNAVMTFALISAIVIMVPKLMN